MSELHGTEAPDVETVGTDRPAPPPVEPTGHAHVDEALARLDRLPDLDLASHPEEYDAIHGALREALANAGRDGTSLDAP